MSLWIAGSLFPAPLYSNTHARLDVVSDWDYKECLIHLHSSRCLKSLSALPVERCHLRDEGWEKKNIQVKCSVRASVVDVAFRCGWPWKVRRPTLLKTTLAASDFTHSGAGEMKEKICKCFSCNPHCHVQKLIHLLCFCFLH